MASARDGRPEVMSIPAALGVAAAVGFAVMNAEIAAGRLFAPYYGTSTSTWALLIATVLSSLSLGNLLGGAWSRRPNPRTTLTLALIGAALLLLLLPWAGPRILAGSLDRFHGGHVASLVAMAAIVAGLLAVPLVVLGSVSPLLLQAVASRTPARDAGVGTLSGQLGAASTVGSLVGTLGAGLLLIPWLGTTRTLWVGSLLLAVTAVALGRRTLRVDRTPRLGAALLLLVLFASAGRGDASTSNQGRVRWVAESLYNHLEVVDVGSERQLRVNDGFAVQSFHYQDGTLPVQGVWDYYALAPTWARRPSPRNVLLLGLGGGTTAHVYRQLYPDASITGVELDATMVRAGVEQLGLRLDGVEVVVGDARPFVGARARHAGPRYDVVVLDAFQFPYVPFQLASREFFAELAACLDRDGVLVVNVGRYREHRDVVHAVSRTLASVFPHVHAVDPDNVSNTILVAARHLPTEGVGLAGLRVGERTRHELRKVAARTSSPRPAAWPDDAPLLTDDHAPVEWLTDRILWRAL